MRYLLGLFEGDPEVPTKSRLSVFFRVAVSLLFLVVVYATVDFGSLVDTLARITTRGALLIIALYVIGQVVSAVKWRIFITEAGISCGLGKTIRAYFFGMFVNTFGLGTVGGDVARSFALLPTKGQRAGALATVVADRVHGLATLLCIGALAILIVQPPVIGSSAPVLAIFAVLLITSFWCFGPGLLTRIFPAEHKYGTAAAMAGSAFPRTLRPFLLSTAISVFFHCLQIAMHVVIARELGAELSLGYLFATVPLVNVASAMPLTINGLGLREAMYLLLFVPAGVSRETAVAFGAVWIVSVTVVSAAGGLILAAKLKTSSTESTKLSNHPGKEQQKIRANA